MLVAARPWLRALPPLVIFNTHCPKSRESAPENCPEFMRLARARARAEYALGQSNLHKVNAAVAPAAAVAAAVAR